MIKLLSAIVFFPLIFTLDNTSVSVFQDARTIVESYLEAHNKHDVEAALAFLTDDIKFEQEGVWLRSGKAEVRAMIEEWDRAVNTTLEVTRLRDNDNTVTGVAVEHNDWYTAAGIESFQYDSITFTVTEGLISEIICVPSSQSNELLGDILLKFINWAIDNKASELPNIKEDGAFAFTAQTASHWISLLSEWQQAINQ